jgi:hypothetical protein
MPSAIARALSETRRETERRESTEALDQDRLRAHARPRPLVQDQTAEIALEVTMIAMTVVRAPRRQSEALRRSILGGNDLQMYLQYSQIRECVVLARWLNFGPRQHEKLCIKKLL